ncbi:MAG: cyclic nucleotide-binding domain-containing protein, partial [Polaromonas sp.]|nr:cyclic nucleotide-binding domain-containing protein [Polaromonas sp.]
MKGLFGRLKHPAAPRDGDEYPDSVLFSTAFADQGVDPSMLVPWEARAN